MLRISLSFPNLRMSLTQTANYKIRHFTWGELHTGRPYDVRYLTRCKPLHLSSFQSKNCHKYDLWQGCILGDCTRTFCCKKKITKEMDIVQGHPWSWQNSLTIATQPVSPLAFLLLHFPVQCASFMTGLL